MSKELFIFPCIGKRPATANGLYDARPEGEWDTASFESWGAPCGAINGFFVIDVDKQHGGLEEAAKHDFGPTLRINTPSGGFHLYYKYDEETCGSIRNGVSVLPGIDVRSTGGYVVLYGQVELSKTLPAPAWLLELLKKPAKKLADLSAYGEVGEGGRNHYLAAAAGRMQKIGVLTLAALSEINEAKCNPPLEEAEVTSIFNSISRYAPESTPAEDEEIRPIVWAHEFSSSVVDYLSNKNLVKGEPTGLEELDKLLGGGKRLGELTVTLAEAKTGKNTFWHWLQLPWLNRGVPIGYASRELSPEIEVLPNLLTLGMGKNLYQCDDIDEGEVLSALRAWKLAFAPGYGAMAEGELFTWMDHCRVHGVQYFFIDHLHYMLLNPEDFMGISDFMRQLKSYARKHNVHVDLIVQPKLQEQGTRLSLNSLRGGASIGQTLDNLVTMTRERDEQGKLINVVKITLEVARSKLASLGSFYLQYDKQSMTFQVVEEQEVIQEENPITRTPSPIYIQSQQQAVSLNRDEPKGFSSLEAMADPELSPLNAIKMAANIAHRVKIKRLE